MPRRILQPDHHHRFIRRRDPARDEGVRGVDRRHALEIDVGLGKLRADIVHVVGHPPQDGVGDRLLGVAAIPAVAVQLLGIHSIDDGGNDADLGATPGDIDLLVDGAPCRQGTAGRGPFREAASFSEGAGAVP